MWLIASDLHLTDAPRDAYRFGIFDYLAEQANAYSASDIFLLGDITDRKDNHSGAFINAIAVKFIRLYDETRASIHILQGNHDYTDPDNPTLLFLSRLNAVDIRWYSPKDNIFCYPKSEVDHPVIMFPFCRNEDDFKERLKSVGGHEYPAVFFHQTFHGAKASSGMEMNGIPVALAHRINAKRYFSGDIHVPQAVGKVEYVGSPYQIRFGDEFQGRIILYNPVKDEMKSLHLDTIKKRTLTIAKPSQLTHMRIGEGDQLKIRMKLSRDELADWQSIEASIVAAVKDAGAILCGVEVKEDVGDNPTAPAKEWSLPAEVFDDFCASNSIDGDVKKEGESYL